MDRPSDEGRPRCAIAADGDDLFAHELGNRWAARKYLNDPEEHTPRDAPGEPESDAHHRALGVSRHRKPIRMCRLSAGRPWRNAGLQRPASSSQAQPLSTRCPSLSWLLVHWKTRSEEHTSELQSRENLVCRLLLEKKKK